MYYVYPISEQFPHVSSCNYAENAPIANVDLWGLQKYYAANGSYIGSYGDSEEERVVNDINKTNQVAQTLDKGKSEELNDTEIEYLTNNSARLLRAEDLNGAYDEFAIKYKDFRDRETAMAVYEGFFTDSEGKVFNGYQLGSLETEMKGDDGGASVFIGGSTIPYKSNFWSLHSAIHTHPYGKVNEFSGYDRQRNGGPRYGFAVTNDLGWAVKFNANVLLTVPSSNQIATFKPSVYNMYMTLTGASKYQHYERNPQIRRATTLRTIGQ